ncbi:hypothetical protein Tco_0791139 [Tanacetum coccineum]
MGLWYPKDSGFELTAFSDADHAGCINTRKSTSGGIQFLGVKIVAGCQRNRTALQCLQQRQIEQTPKPKGVPCSPKKNQPGDESDDVDVVLRGQIRDEGASGSRGGATGSIGRGGAAMSRGGASGYRGGASVSRGVVGGSRGGSSVSCGASGSRGRGAGGSGDASGSRDRGAGGFGGASGSRGKKKVGTSGFAKWFGLQDEPEQTQDEPQQTQHEPVVTQDEDQVEQTEDQAEIELTQLEQTQ